MPISKEKKEILRKNQEEKIRKRISYETNNEYTLFSGYTGYKNHIYVKHNKCGTVFKTTPANFFSGNRCTNKKCLKDRRHFSNPRTKTTSQFISEVHKLVGNEYSVYGNYFNWKTKMKFKHNTCGNVFYMEANSFLQGRRCPKCQHKVELSKRSKTDEEFKKEIFDKYKGEYQVVGTYVSQAHKILIKHMSCGNTWLTSPGNILFGFGCPKCGASKGETLVQEVLDEEKIKYTPQKEFVNLYDKKCLSYDFYIPSIKLLIEYQGQQHFFPVEFFGGKKSFKKQCIHDDMKRKYAKENNMALLEIPYTVTDKQEVNKMIDVVKQRITSQN